MTTDQGFSDEFIKAMAGYSAVHVNRSRRTVAHIWT